MDTASQLVQACLGSGLVLLTWSGVSLVLMGGGLGFQRIFGITKVEGAQLFQAIWVGVFLVVGYLQVMHLVVPVGKYHIAVGMVLSGIGWIGHRREIAEWIKAKRGEALAQPAFVICIFGAWVANRAMGPDHHWDSGLYHTQSILWIETFHIIPGLGNLLGPLASNSSGHLLAALADVGPWAGHANHVVNGFFVFVLGAQILFRCGTFRGAPSVCAVRSVIFDISLLGVLCALSLSVEISSYTTDAMPGIILFVAFSKIYAMLVCPSDHHHTNAYALVVVMGLLATSVCLKVTSVPLVVMGGTLFLVSWLLANKTNPYRHKAIVWALVVILFLGGVWMVRGGILSGFVLYPSTAFPLPVDWRMPEEQVQAERMIVQHVSRWYYKLDALSGGLEWISGWISNLFKNVWEFQQIVWPVLLSGGGMIGYLCVRNRRTRDQGPPLRGWLLLGVVLGAILIWFCIAPNSRYGYTLFWIMASIVLAQTIGSMYSEDLHRGMSVRVRPVIQLCVIPIVIIQLAFSVGKDGMGVTEAMGRIFQSPHRTQWFHPSPAVNTKRFTVHPGLEINVPFPLKDNRCMSAPIPCTPYRITNLRLRNPESLQGGFFTIGPWQSVDWPGPNMKNLLPFWHSTGLLQAPSALQEHR